MKILISSSFRYSVFSIISVFGLCISGYAQTAKEDLPSKEEAKKAVINSAEAAQEILKPANHSPQLERILKMVAKAESSNADYLKRVANGEVKPWQELIDNQAQMQKQVVGLSATYQKFLEAKHPVIIEDTSNELRRILALIGPFLQNADYVSVDQSITKEQADFIEETSLADRGPAALPDDLKSKADTLKLSGPSSYFTLINLPCPIVLKAKPNSTIYLYTGTGGRFSNGLSMEILKADKHGDAVSFWVSPGDSVGPGSILISSPQAINQIALDINVVKPMLIKIPDIDQLNQLQKMTPVVPKK